MKTNFRLSGSIFSIAQKCPGSLAISLPRKLMEERQDAQEGTDAHEVIADDIESVRRFLPAKTKTLQEHIEEEVSGTYKGLKLSGGVDYWSVDFTAGILYVYDWKTGPMGIDHLGPAQIEFYAYLILLSFGVKGLKIKEVILCLVSPRLNQKKIFTRTPDDLIKLERAFDLILSGIKKKEKPQPGEWCRWCSKRFVCVEFRNELKRFAEPSFHGKPLQRITAGDLKTLAVAAVAVADIRKYVMEMLANGVSIPGVCVENQNAARIFGDGIDAGILAERLSDEITTRKAVEFLSYKLKTPAQLEKEGFLLDRITDLISTTQRKVLKIESVPEGSTKKQPKSKTTEKTKTKIKVKRT